MSKFAKGDRVIVRTLRGDEPATVEYVTSGADHPQVNVHFDDDTYCTFSASRVRNDSEDHGPGCDGPLNCTCASGLLEVLRAEANRPESLAVRAAATARAEAEFLAELDAEGLTIEQAQAGDRVEVATGAGFLRVTVDYVMGERPGWARVHYHHDNGYSYSRCMPYSTPITRPAVEATR